MIFTLERILDSLAGVLQGRYPDYPVYYSPNQQGTEYPCFFIFFMPSEIKSQPGSRYMRDLGVDIVFVQQRNIVDGNAELLRIAGWLDEALELFPYACDGKQVMIRMYERQWQNDDGELHYQFHIKQRVWIKKDVNRMGTMEENNAHIKQQEASGKEETGKNGAGKEIPD